MQKEEIMEKVEKFDTNLIENLNSAEKSFAFGCAELISKEKAKEELAEFCSEKESWFLEEEEKESEFLKTP